MPEYRYRAQPANVHAPVVEGQAQSEHAEELARRLAEVGLSVLHIQEVAHITKEEEDPILGGESVKNGEREEALQTLTRKVGEVGTVQMTNLFLQQALQDGASDLHMVAVKDGGAVNYRIDGIMYPMANLPARLFTPLVSRLKLMAEMEVNERQKPQQGRIAVRYSDKDYEIASSTLPTVYGESVALRLFAPMIAADWTPDRLKAPEDELKSLLDAPNGLILFAGPTGSGKTTVLFSALNVLATKPLNVLMVAEDSGFRLNGVYHSKPEIPVEIALRALSERDVDVIGIGDMESRTAVKAALEAAGETKVLAVFHAEDAIHALQRLHTFAEGAGWMKVVRGVVASRLMRKNCAHCKSPYASNESDLRALGLRVEDASQMTFYRGAGCEICKGSGFKGRVAAYEILNLDDEMARRLAKIPAKDWRGQLHGKGYRTFYQGAVERVKEGETSVEEALRLTLKGEETNR